MLELNARSLDAKMNPNGQKSAELVKIYIFKDANTSFSGLFYRQQNAELA